MKFSMFLLCFIWQFRKQLTPNEPFGSRSHLEKVKWNRLKQLHQTRKIKWVEKLNALNQQNKLRYKVDHSNGNPETNTWTRHRLTALSFLNLSFLPTEL